MLRAKTVSIVGGLAVLGSASGLYLGQAAIGEISPAFFSEREASAFYADMSANRPSAAPNSALASLGSDVSITSCTGCRAFPEDYRPLRDASIEAELTGWSAPETYAPELTAEEAPAAAEPDLEREAIARYSTYAVATEQVETPVAQPVESPQTMAAPAADCEASEQCDGAATPGI